MSVAGDAPVGYDSIYMWISVTVAFIALSLHVHGHLSVALPVVEKLRQSYTTFVLFSVVKYV